MAINFPNSPTNGQTFDVGSMTFEYNSTKARWEIKTGVLANDISDLSDVNLTVQPETLEIQVASNFAGHGGDWQWTWLQSSLPYARLPITNLPQLSVPLYMQGNYVINNFANTQYGDMTQSHAFKLKWIEGSGDANLIDWVTTTVADDTHPDINGGASTSVQKLSFSVPTTITPPTLTAPTVSYDVSSTTGAYVFTGTMMGNNPEIGPFYRGGTYTININAAGHPFYFTTDNGTGFVAGTYVGEYTTGVTGSRTDSGTITFTVPNDAPDTLYYQCGNHSAMRGNIRVKDLTVETNENGNYIIYGQHTQDGHAQKMEIRPIPELSSQMCIVYDATTEKFVPQDLATYVENTPAFKNKIKEVAGTATLVAPDGTSLVASVEIYDTETYLPLVGNTQGDIAFALDTNKLYIWNTTAWVEASAEVDLSNYATLSYVNSQLASSSNNPTITSVSPNAYDGSDATTITVQGTYYDIGTVVDFITAGGTVVRAQSTTVVTQGELSAVTPRAFAANEGPLDVKVTTAGGNTVTATDQINTGDSPVWSTAASLGTYNKDADFSSIDLDATDPDGQPVTYSIVSGSLPPGISMDAYTGNFSGTLGTLSGDTTYSFVGGATDSSGNLTTRSFDITVLNQLSYPNLMQHSGNFSTADLQQEIQAFDSSGDLGNNAYNDSIYDFGTSRSLGIDDLGTKLFFNDGQDTKVWTLTIPYDLTSINSPPQNFSYHSIGGDADWYTPEVPAGTTIQTHCLTSNWGGNSTTVYTRRATRGQYLTGNTSTSYDVSNSQNTYGMSWADNGHRFVQGHSNNCRVHNMNQQWDGINNRSTYTISTGSGYNQICAEQSSWSNNARIWASNGNTIKQWVANRSNPTGSSHWDYEGAKDFPHYFQEYRPIKGFVFTVTTTSNSLIFRRYGI